MNPFRTLSAVGLTLLGLAWSRPGTASPSPADRADFSGTWKLNEEQSTRIADLVGKEGVLPDAPLANPMGGRGGRGTGGGSAGIGDSAFQLLEDARRLVVVDQGDAIRITRGEGSKRTIYPDGEERELDDGLGPATVTAKRKGARGERIVVSSKWPVGRDVSETWELLSNPRRLLVTTKVSSRRSFTMKRVYDPVLDGAPEPAPLVKVVVAPSEPSGSAAPAAAPEAPVDPPAGLAKCSVRPPRGASGEELARLAKVSQAAAERRALAFVAPRKPASVITSDVEVYEGCLVWTFVLRFTGTKGSQEIAVDAGDGKLLTSEVDAGGAGGAEKP